MALGMRRFALCSAKRAALCSAGLELLCKPKTKLVTSKVAKQVMEVKKTYRKFPSFDENQLPTEAAEENVVEIEALGTANPKTKLMT
jgi:hypothetical protein